MSRTNPTWPLYFSEKEKPRIEEKKEKEEGKNENENEDQGSNADKNHSKDKKERKEEKEKKQDDDDDDEESDEDGGGEIKEEGTDQSGSFITIAFYCKNKNNQERISGTHLMWSQFMWPAV